jgi:hypothetical protein
MHRRSFVVGLWDRIKFLLIDVGDTMLLGGVWWLMEAISEFWISTNEEYTNKSYFFYLVADVLPTGNWQSLAYLNGHGL